MAETSFSQKVLWVRVCFYRKQTSEQNGFGHVLLLVHAGQVFSWSSLTNQPYPWAIWWTITMFGKQLYGAAILLPVQKLLPRKGIGFIVQISNSLTEWKKKLATCRNQNLQHSVGTDWWRKGKLKKMCLVWRQRLDEKKPVVCLRFQQRSVDMKRMNWFAIWIFIAGPIMQSLGSSWRISWRKCNRMIGRCGILKFVYSSWNEKTIYVL